MIPSKPRPTLRRRAARVSMLLGAALLLGLLLAEAVVRLYSPDWRFVKRLLYYQRADVTAHQVDPDPRLRYRLRPGAHDFHPRVVHVNAFGFRGPERTREKPADVFRILCVGGSNTYGGALFDEETWPARLEARLNEQGGARYEVWNAGTCAYVPTQMVLIAREAIERYPIDLVILALSNTGGPAFLWGAPVEPFFDHDPELWRTVIPADLLEFPHWMPRGVLLRAVAHVRAYRMALLGLMAATGRAGVWEYPDYDSENAAAVHEFLAWARGRVRVVVFLCPGCLEELHINRKFIAGEDVPVFILRADDRPAEYRDLHPPAPVMAWYAEELAAWLRAEGLLPPLEAMECTFDP